MAVSCSNRQIPRVPPREKVAAVFVFPLLASRLRANNLVIRLGGGLPQGLELDGASWQQLGISWTQKGLSREVGSWIRRVEEFSH